MFTLFSKNKIFFFLTIFLFLYGAWARIVNLTWGSPFFFHPDENNVTYAIKSLSFPSQMNPHFFAYGSFPMYMIYFASLIVSSFHTPPFEVIAYVSRSYSAVLSIATILSLLYIGKKIFNTLTGVIAATLASMSVGFIEYAHFGTFEMWLTFLSLWFFYLWFSFSTTPSLKRLFLLGVLTGLLVGTKVSTVILFALPLLSIGFLFLQHKGKYQDIAKYLLVYILPLVIIFLITNPYAILDFPSFFSSMKYESSVALGTLPVFYTQGFTNTVPVIFQFLYVYPFLVNPLNLLLFFISLLVLSRQNNKGFFYVVIFFALLFFSQAFLYVKWTRYMVPTLPFMYLLIAEFLFVVYKKVRLLTPFVISIGFFYSLFFLHTTYLSQDTRISAASWAQSHITSQNQILSEPYDLGIIPFNNYYAHISLFDFYSLDSNSSQQDVLTNQLSTTNTIILPSQRLVRSRTLSPQVFPLSAKFYNNLFIGSQFVKVYETPCDIWCKIVYMGDPIRNVEETASVFDRPLVFIFERNK